LAKDVEKSAPFLNLNLSNHQKSTSNNR